MSNETEVGLNTPKDSSDYAAYPSGVSSLPYYPGLKKKLQSVTGALVLIYLEIHYPGPRPPDGPISTTYVTLDLDAVAADLEVSRRTLFVNLSVLCAWWPTEEARSRAARSGREFINPEHSRYGRLKFYSATGSKTWRPGTIIQLRRNYGHLKMLLQNAGIVTLAGPVPTIAIPVPK